MNGHKMWYVLELKYYLVTKKNEVLILAKT